MCIRDSTIDCHAQAVERRHRRRVGQTTHAPAVAFGLPDAAPVATLDGLRVTINGEPVEGQFVAAPGDRVGVDLLWQPLTPDRYPYQSIVEIVDHTQQKVAAQDLQVGWRDTVLDLWRPYLCLLYTSRCV